MKFQPSRRVSDLERKQCELAFLDAVLSLGAATTDDAHDRYELPPDIDQRTWGAVIGGLKARRLIKRIGETPTRRQMAHGRRILVYVAVDPDQLRRHFDRLAMFAAKQRASQRTLPFGDTDPDTRSGPAS